MGHDVIIIKVNGDRQFKVGLRRELDVNLVKSDASFRGWGRKLRTSMNNQEISVYL